MTRMRHGGGLWHWRRWLASGLHVLGAVVGGYALTALTVATTGALLARLGMARSEAVVLASMLGVVAYLAVLLWSISAKSVLRQWAVLTSGAMAMAGWSWLVR